MAMEIFEDKAYVDMDGSYGQGVVVFDSDELTDEQWEKLTDMSDGDRAVYVVAIINGDEDAIKQIEEDNFGDEEWDD